MKDNIKQNTIKKTDETLFISSHSLSGREKNERKY